MRIVQLTAENFKRLKAVSIKPDGTIVQICGENGSGKSSLLDAIFCAIAGKRYAPTKPIRAGQTSARIKLDLGDVIVTRKFTEGGETQVLVESAEGARFPSPQRLLDDLFGELAFDPLAFSRAEPKSRLETLRRLVPLDVDVDALDEANARDYELRRGWNSKVKSLREKVAMLANGVDQSMDTTLTDIDALTGEMERASEHNASLHQISVTRTTMRQEIVRTREVAANKRLMARALIAEAEDLENEAERNELVLEAAPPLAAPIDVSDLRAQIAAAMKANALRESQERQRAAHKAAVAELEQAEAKSRELTAVMEARTVEKQAAISRAAMPVDGLGFGDGDVLFNNIPFDQASTAEQIRVSMAIAMAANPKLRVVLIKDGSLLDAKSLAIIDQMATEHEYQVFVETVRTDSKVGVVLEAGEVTAIDGVPVQAVANEETLESIGA